IAAYQEAQAAAGPAAAAGGIPPGLTVEEMHTLYRGLGRAHELANDWPGAEAAHTALLALGRQTDRRDLVCQALNHLATVAAQSAYDLARASSLLEEAQRVAEALGDTALLAETGWNLAQLRFYQWRLEDALLEAERAARLAEECALPELFARCRSTAVYSKMMLGRNWPQVVAEALATRRLFAALGNPVMEADVLCMVTIMQVNGGLYEAGIAAGEEGIALARQAATPWGQANCTWPVARAYLERGAYDQALAVAELGVAASQAAQHPPTLAFNLAVLGRVQATLGDLATARTIHEQAWAITTALGHPLLLDWIAGELCADCVLAGDWPAAANHARQAQAARNYATVYPGPGRMWETLALLHAGAADAAAEDLRRFAEHLPQIGYTDRYRVQYLRASAELAAHQGGLNAAEAHLQEAIPLAESIGMRGELWAMQAALAAVHDSQDRPAVAQEQRAAAGALLHRLASEIADPARRARILAASGLS
ncbi:MAG TPA: hypothetical protein VM536_13735, partial [Chloroflexia bacterium]|nr:hypothetical protein [Chloroflexia bacterium]